MLTKEEFGKRLKTAMENRGMKQATLAEATGTSAANVSNYVLGKAFPPVDILAKMAEILNTSLDLLCDVGTRDQLFEPQTIGDVARLVMHILEALPLDCALETITVLEPKYSGTYFDADYNEVPRYETVEVEIPIISFRIGEIRTFITDLMKMRKLLSEKTFDSNFYKRWLNDRMQALEKIPLNPEMILGEIAEDEDYSDGSLPL